VPDNPARGKAQGRIIAAAYECFGGGPQTGAKPRSRTAYSSPADRFADLTFLHKRSVTPTKINRGGRAAANGTWARTGRNAVGTKQIAPKNARFF